MDGDGGHCTLSEVAFSAVRIYMYSCILKSLYKSKSHQIYSLSRKSISFCRFLATGDTYRDLHFQYLQGEKTIARIVEEVCSAIWEELSGLYMDMPSSAEEWLKIANDFETKWNFPNCIGAIDGKHCSVMAPRNTGSLHFNYKGYFSVVLMALVDANYQFIYADVGGLGRNSDGGTFRNCSLGQALMKGNIELPQERILPGEELGPMPYVMVGDEAFPLQENLMRPFPGKDCNYTQNVFNYRLSSGERLWVIGHTIACVSHKDGSEGKHSQKNYKGHIVLAQHVAK